MNLILSRKGFDSSCGGCASPILPDGRLCWLPIPDTTSKISYGELSLGDLNLGAIVEQVTRGELGASSGTHLDPDLRGSTLPREKGWRPLFGQAGAPYSHLENHRVGAGDIFLFFGWFRHTHIRHGKLEFAPDAPNVHLIFGWLQIGSVEPVMRFPERFWQWARYHPHLHRLKRWEQEELREAWRTGRTFDDEGARDSLYVASNRLRVDGMKKGLPGAGMIRRFRPELILTTPGQTRRNWKLPVWFYPQRPEAALSCHNDLSKWRKGEDCCYLKTVCRGQEFVLHCGDGPEAANWLGSLLASENE